MRKGFDNEKYLIEQSKYILERMNQFSKLYLEFGGKLTNDLHAKRVLPGYDENLKIKLLQKIKDKIEVIICIYSGDIEKHKKQGDFGVTYEKLTFRLIDQFKEFGIATNSIVITRFENQQSALKLKNKLELNSIKVYLHQPTKGYPYDVDRIVSDEGYGKNPFIETTKPIIVVTGPGPGSGKLATCLNQLYHEFKTGRKACYSKFETFPVWNIPLKHPLNIAYEASTVDLNDINMIDPFHLEAYGIVATSYNRDIEAYPLLRRILEKILNDRPIYKSPSDMGVNMIKSGIIDENIIIQASQQEVIRRYFRAACDFKRGNLDKNSFDKTKILLNSLNLKPEDRLVVGIAKQKLDDLKNSKQYVGCFHSAVALQIEDKNNKIVTGKRSNLMTSCSAAIINAIKYLANVSDEIPLLSASILEPILKLKSDNLEEKNEPLNCEEILISLSISAVTNPTAELAMKQLKNLKGAQAHSTHFVSGSDEQTYRKLGIDLTCDPEFIDDSLYNI